MRCTTIQEEMARSVGSSSDAGVAQKLPAPKQCETPRLAKSALDNPQVAIETPVTLKLKRPSSKTPISRFEIELCDELTGEKKTEKIEDPEVWTSQAGADGSFEYTLQMQLDAGRRYRAQVFAVGTGAKQNGMRSKPLTFSTPMPRVPPPERPAKPEADDVQQTELVMTFTLPKSDAPITQIEVLFREDNDLFQDSEAWDEMDLLPELWKDSTDSIFIDKLDSLEPGTRYLIKWRVRSEEWSDYSEELSVCTAPADPTAPSQSASPSGLTTSASPTTPAASAAPKKAAPEVCKAPEQVSSRQEEVTIALTKPKSETAVQHFEFLMRQGTNADYPKMRSYPKIENLSLWEALPAEETFTYTLTGLVPGATYFVKVRAVGTKEAKRRNKWSEEARLFTTEYSPPEAPAEPSCSGQQQNALELVLAKPASVDEITALELATQRVPTEGEEEPDWDHHLLGPDTVSWTVPDLLPGQRYRCMLRAKAAIWGPWSDVMEASTSIAAVPPPVNPEAAAPPPVNPELEEAEGEETIENHKAEAQRLFKNLAQKDLSKPKHRDVINQFLAQTVEHLRARHAALSNRCYSELSLTRMSHGAVAPQSP